MTSYTLIFDHATCFISLQAALIRWGGEKPLSEYRFEHSTERETIKRRKIKLLIESSDRETSPVVYSYDQDDEVVADYKHYAENGKE